MERIDTDKATEANSDHPRLISVLKALWKGDTLVVVKLDRLARSMKHLIELGEAIQAKGSVLRVLDAGIDTGTPVDQFTFTFTFNVSGPWLHYFVNLERGLRRLLRRKKEGKYMNAVREAGKMIAKRLEVNDKDISDEVIEAFRVANDWRNLHAVPMRSLRMSMMACMRMNDIGGNTSSRLKRMAAIRGKLQRGKVYLDKLQDLGGCRAILPSVGDVERLTDSLRNYRRVSVWKENDYINNPKFDGYRSHHLAIAFEDRQGREIFNNLRVELQIRTLLQHSWATTVEAVGRLRGEYLKGSQGDQRWLRLFILVSAEFASAEGCRNATDSSKERRQEIIEIANKIDAVNILDNLAYVVRFTETAPNVGEKPQFYLIMYNKNDNTVSVEPKFVDKEAFSSYLEEERKNRFDDSGNDALLVDVGQVETLRKAFPNYFGDVQLFKEGLSMIIKGEKTKEFSLKALQKVKTKKEDRIDLQWLMPGYRRWF